MGVRFPSVSSNSLVNTTIVTTAETVAVTSPPFTPPLDGSTIVVLARAAVTGGSGVTSYQLKLRRGTSTAGTQLQVTVANLTNLAALANELVTWYFDNPGAVSGQQYSLTISCFGATGNSAINDAAIFVFAL